MSQGFEALCAVLKAATDMACGEVLLEEDGEVGIDWLRDKATVSVSVRADGRITWAALIDGWTSHQTCTNVTDELREAFRRFDLSEKGAPTS